MLYISLNPQKPTLSISKPPPQSTSFLTDPYYVPFLVRAIHVGSSPVDRTDPLRDRRYCQAGSRTGPTEH